MRARLSSLLATACLLLATTAVNPAARAQNVETLRAQAQRVADRVTELEVELRDLQARKSELDAKVNTSSARIGYLELQLNEAERSLTDAQAIVEARAIEVYKTSSTGQNLEMLLSADDMSELQLIAEAQATAAYVDRRALEGFAEVSARAEAAQTDLEDRKAELLNAQAEIDSVQTDIAGSLDVRRDALSELSDQIRELQEEARAAARAASSVPTIPSDLPAPSGDLAARLVGTGPSDGVPGAFTSAGVTFEGEASWYGPGFEGNLTANGDVYDSSLYTAASKTLPLNTYLYIEYEGRGCVVLVNDRGPYWGERILDLSRGTAAAIGMEHAGVGWVKAEILVRN